MKNAENIKYCIDDKVYYYTPYHHAYPSLSDEIRQGIITNFEISGKENDECNVVVWYEINNYSWIEEKLLFLTADEALAYINDRYLKQIRENINSYKKNIRRIKNEIQADMEKLYSVEEMEI